MPQIAGMLEVGKWVAGEEAGWAGEWEGGVDWVGVGGQMWEDEVGVNVYNHEGEGNEFPVIQEGKEGLGVAHLEEDVLEEFVGSAEEEGAGDEAGHCNVLELISSHIEGVGVEGAGWWINVVL